ncbi:MAG: tetratricopeptide repeat protein [Rhodobacteraceae bacterium]|nr:tetratricopeptide repeat protein [Paracoccaceae bacterium]
MKTLLLPLALLAMPALADCPALPDRTAEKAELMAAMRDAGNEGEARQRTDALWQFWATAPDAAAQEMLDYGMRRRAEYDFEGATESFDRLIAYCPDYAEGYNQRAFIHFLREDFPAALEDLEKTLEISPDHIAALAGLALTLDRLGRFKASQGALREALKLNPWLPERAMLKKPGTDL